MPNATRTTNPLHFEDLEPHRFEDLVRQLAYEFRLWTMIEATGRLGSDEGIDIRAVEASMEIVPADDDEGDDEGRETSAGRLWIFQCKREKKLGPTDLKSIVREALRSLPEGAYGLIIAAACDFSKKARDAALEAARASSVQEFFLWGKAELEDQLFQPKNDHLLFAYFGISLQLRRRSFRTSLRSRIATKKQAIRLLGPVQGDSDKTVLIRNALNEEYPRILDVEAFKDSPQWWFYKFVCHDPDHLVFELLKFYALGNHETGEWDLFESDISQPWQRVRGLPQDGVRQDPDHWKAYAYWSHRPQEERGHFIRYGIIHYDRVLAIDEHGDSYHEGPHVLVEFTSETGPFDRIIDNLIFGSSHNRQAWIPDEAKRRNIFPNPLPDPLPTPDV